MNPTMNDITQIMPAPANLRVVFLDQTENKEFCEPVAALALVAVDDGIGRIDRDVLALGISDTGLYFSEYDPNFERLEWSLRKPCPCSTTSK